MTNDKVEILDDEGKEIIKKLGVIKGILVPTMPNFELSQYVAKNILPLIGEADKYYKNTKLRAFYINCKIASPELKAIKTSLKTMWRLRPKAKRTDRRLHRATAIQLVNNSKSTKTELKDVMNNLGIKFSSKDTKPELVTKICKGVRYSGDTRT